MSGAYTVEGSRKSGRQAAVAVGMAVVLGLGVGLAWPPRSSAVGTEDSAAVKAGDSGASSARTRDEDPKLYQLLYDYQFTEPLSSLGQKVRILIWLRYIGFSVTQQQHLLSLARKFEERHKALVEQQESIIKRYEAELEPLYQQVYQSISVSAPDEAQLDTLARQIKGVNLAYRREDELQTLRIGMVRAILSDERDFLQTLSREQEEKLVTSLFFMRREIDPFANPGDYRSVIGPTWNAGDFSSLLKQKSRKESHLNIGGLWGMGAESGEEGDYANIQRPIVLFFALKEAGLVPALEESISLNKG